MLRLSPDHPIETLWDGLLPPEVRTLPQDLERIDELLADSELLVAFRDPWDAQARERGRPSVPMAVYLRLMVVKQRTGWGYETLMREVSDSLHLRRFCWIALHDRVPHESTVRKLTRRLGSAVVDELIRHLIDKARRERRFRPRAMRCDSTVVEADVRYPTDAGLAGDAVRILARVARQVRQAIPSIETRVRDRSRAVGRRLRALSRTIRRRSGEAKAAVRRLTEETGEKVRSSVREAKRLLAEAKLRRARGPRLTPHGRRKVIERLEETIAQAERIVEQIRQRFAGEKISDRLISLADADARPVRRGKRAKPTEFGYVVQFTEVTSRTGRGARGVILPPKLRAGSAPENSLLPDTVAELVDLDLKLREAAFDAGFHPPTTLETLAPTGAEPFIVGSHHPGGRATRRRLARYRVGCEGRIAHLKREYHAGRSRLRGTDGARIWESWGVLAYDLDTIAAMPTA